MSQYFKRHYSASRVSFLVDFETSIINPITNIDFLTVCAGPVFKDTDIRRIRVNFQFSIEHELDISLEDGYSKTDMIDFFLRSPDFLGYLDNENRDRIAWEVVSMLWPTKKTTRELATSLPGVKEFAPCPEKMCISHPEPAQVATLIMHLNDYWHWTREAIADWLETLDIDMEFKNVD